MTVPADALRLRAATAADHRFLADMLLVALNWNRDRAAFHLADIDLEPMFARYIEGWPRLGDQGVVAESSGEPVGAVWVRLFGSAEPGFGFVSADVPELSIGVRDGLRGRGVGSALMERIHRDAGAAGARRISLSVEPGNRAMALYEKLGYRVAVTRLDMVTMVKDLR